MPKQIVLQMKENYPFGQLSQNTSEQNRILVQKTLHFSTPEQLDTIKQMIHFIKAIRHPSLVNLIQTLESEEEVHLLYEYVPFRLQKWLLSVDEDIINKIQAELTELADFLIRSNVKFSFNFNCVGISSQMQLKYFLNQFSVDVEDEQERRKCATQEIQMLLKELKQLMGKNEQEPIEIRFGSLSTNSSTSPLEEETSPLNKTISSIQKQLDNSQIAAKVQNSMQKSLQLLNRLKNYGKK